MAQIITSTAGVVEYAMTPKHSNVPCEDGLVITADFVAVLDGMSDPQGEHQPGQVAAFTDRLTRAIAELPRQATARQAIDELSGVRACGGAVGALYSRARRELWRIGDVHWAIDDACDLADKQVDEAMTAFRAAINHAKLAAGCTIDHIRSKDPGLKATFELLRIQNALANRPGPWGFGVLNGTHVPDEHLHIVKLPARAQMLVLASDGYLTPAHSLDQAEADLAAALSADPACIGVLARMGKALRDGANGPDDRTYVRVRIDEENR